MLLDYLKGALKAVAAAVVPLIIVWAQTGTLDERALGAAAATSFVVWLVPNLHLEQPILAVLKALAAAVTPFVAIWVSTGAVDGRAVIAAVLPAVAVYFIPNLGVTDASGTGPARVQRG